MKLSDHFTLSELTKSSTALRLGIDNSLNPELSPQLVVNLEHLCTKVLEPIRAHYGVPLTPNSGYRCPDLNRAVGGSPKSQHMEGEAVDIEVPGVSNVDLAYWCAENLDFDQIILEHYDGIDPNSGWVHISYKRCGGNRKDVRTMGPRISGVGRPERKA